MKRPSFQFYPADFLSDYKVLAMSNEQIGGYMKLLCTMWLEDDCALPNDSVKLEAISRLGSTTLQPVLDCFTIIGDKITHKRLMKERAKQDEWKRKSRKGGLQSAKSRLKGGSRVVQPNVNSSTSTSTSIKKENLIKEKNADPLWDAFVALCLKRSLDFKIPARRYLELREEYSAKLAWWPQVQACVDWCYDNNKKILTTNRLRNWMVNAIKFAKNKEIKFQQMNQDKKTAEYFTPKLPKQVDKIWQPPV